MDPPPPPPMLTFPPVPPHYAIVTSWTTMQASQYQLHLEAMERQQRMEESFQRALEAQRVQIEELREQLM